MTDPITDMLNRIRNAQAVLKLTVDVPISKIKLEICQILAREGLIKGFEKKGRKNKKIIQIALQYDGKIPAISGMKRISKPGQKIYLPYKKIRKVKGGYGLSIISTSKGLMTNKEARKKRLGGEVICEVW
ncbi:MAG: 30S ribosomal protein S8 [Candidatus Nealsonbacteria bacterium CG_4_10_14_0_8_um_filter_35_10]|uniref:Small ribosomal subunit protein uS8 n=2 Tax=Candidatus Nealsoniibacteriota TaxID=1817911 RepID=A0A2M7R7P0_9BACT|nr:MAG: 30S ribosomal protein S8 [Parcubacteria group bacterium CG1_02_36_42]PIY90814.1 MAG: 30S ribosomal protein S8 [Candidatus Nealsonbacteria bacterium CG_4_10_14_0_8_um_filter_35_10]PJB99702.1 MAG: 30S ribosomal protein S8 [Candidatus Nealsonbacteria bacterium CG_4_9_14_0_8_um_filter_35_12]